MLCGLLTGYAFVLAILARREAVQSLLTRILGVLPQRPAQFLGGVLKRLIDGFSIMASFPHAVMIFAYSLLLWMVFSAMTYLFLLAFGISAPFLVAVTIQVLICLGVALPSAPGFIGTFHAAGRYALALFGIQAVVAVSFATVYHLFSLIACLLLGSISYFTSDFRFDRSIFARAADSSKSEPAGGMQPL
jgi:uncharacterized protein (TIRG00374 family)